MATYKLQLEHIVLPIKQEISRSWIESYPDVKPIVFLVQLTDINLIIKWHRFTHPRPKKRRTQLDISQNITKEFGKGGQQVFETWRNMLHLFNQMARRYHSFRWANHVTKLCWSNLPWNEEIFEMLKNLKVKPGVLERTSSFSRTEN